MRQSLTMLLLGSPDVSVGGMPLRIRSAKTRALLCHLATTTGPQPRSTLATLLWGERPEANARGSLRLALSELRAEVGGWLEITRTHVRFREAGECFVDHRVLCGAPAVATALRLWRGDFMDGVAFCDAPAFGEWVSVERQRMRTLLRSLLPPPGSAASDEVTRLARIITGLDPYDEEAYRVLMASLAGTGNRAAALACYDELRRRLADELGVAPAPPTQALRWELAPRAAARPGPPLPGTELIGRDAEVAALRALLARERLVTLLGPGGIGKTRLAIAATAPESRLDAGTKARAGPAASPGTGGNGLPVETVFVSFAGVRAEAAVTTLARRLDVDLAPPRPALDLLLAHLAARRRRLLLVLDNLEHLPAFDAVIGAVLHAAPSVRVLATSRRRLSLPGQATVTVEGLPGPAAEALFAVRARAARPAFDPDREAAPVAAICAATGGLPLAIELVAGLLRAVPCADLARRLGVDPGLLSAAGPAARPRHACMRTVFETSWHLLDPAGQRALAALSVFGGGCTLEAALEVARTSLDVLVRLVDHSMIRLTSSGRYVIHPLIQQLAAERQSPADLQAARRRHAAYFARLLDRHADALQDASDTEVTAVLGAELDNIRPAWAASGDPGFLDHYWILCLRLHLYEESVAILRRHLEGATENRLLRARHLWMAGTSEHHLARDLDATRLARAALATLGEPLPESRTGLVVTCLTAAARQSAHRLTPPRLTLPPSLGRAPDRPASDRHGSGDHDPGGREREAGGREAGGREAAQALTMLARLAYHQQDLLTMLAASLRQLNAAERTQDPALRAESYANAATIARVAGLHRTATRYGTLADRALAEVEHARLEPAGSAGSAESAGSAGSAGGGAVGGRPVELAVEAANRARLARGLDQLHAGAFEAARRSFTECRARTLTPRVAENCTGMLAETALWQGDFTAAAELFADTAEQAARRVGGDDIGRHWCLTGQVEAMLRIDGTAPERIRQVLEAARASTERRRTCEKELGLRDGPVMRTIQDMRLLTATARLHLRTQHPEDSAFHHGPGDAVLRHGPDDRALTVGVPQPPDDVAAVREVREVLGLAERLPVGQRGMLECWAGLAELLWALPGPPDRASARRLHQHLSRYQARNPGAAARIGWARALVLAVAGRNGPAEKAAHRALAAAERLATPYDRDRAEEILLHLTRPTTRRPSGRQPDHGTESGVSPSRENFSQEFRAR
ncbi:BTAD domain-containing putative transcriptional regulator [Nonomuraea sp. NPDC048882]|uniref:ATP-binding protein n=1 Tax=Nonomuraea sp. NPDC048882 TaxID=3154347 RepID=UPI0033CB0927